MSEEHGSNLPPPEGDETASIPPRPESSREVIGPYRLLGILGEGGMGTVYLAEETRPIRRRVALKIVKLGMDTKQVIARFDSERQALAMMNHPNVAKVFGAGSTEWGRPYFVMEYVAGVPLTEYCDRNLLSLTERLKLFIPICHAIQHAHQKGIIHRDLKPSNILVSIEDGQPVPKVIDFGVAKATEHRLTEMTVFTEQGQLIGTPEYMSPEQAEMTALDIDTRTDVYSLGVLLYELLTGTLPFEPQTLRRAALLEIQQIIREQQPPRPSTRLSSLGDASGPIAQRRQMDGRTLMRELRGDLDWIIMKALEKDRTRRYATAVELANDVLRHLNHEPVLAGPPSTIYRMKKFFMRNRAAVLAGLGFVSALVVALVVSVSLYVRAERERVRTAAAEALAQRRLEQADAVTGFLQNMLASADPFNAETKPVDLTVRQALDKAVDGVDTEFAAQPELESAVRYTLGITYYGLASYGEAEKHLEKALAIRRTLYGNHHPESAEALWRLALAHERQRDLTNAQSMLRDLLTAVGDDSAFAVWRLSGLHELAFIAYQEGRLDESADLFQQVLSARPPDPSKPLGQVAQDLHAYACVQQDRGQTAQADSLFQQAIAMKRSLFGNEHPDLAECMSDYSICLQAQGRLDEADAMARQGFEMDVKLLGHVHPFTIAGLWTFSHVLCAEGRHDEAERLLKEELQIQRGLLGKDHANTVSTLYELGNVAFTKASYGEAIRWYSEAVDVAERAYGSDHLEVAKILTGLGDGEFRKEDYRGAIASYRRAAAIYRQQAPESRLLAQALAGEARCLEALDDWEGALSLWRETLPMRRKVYGDQHWAVGESLHGIGLATLSQGKAPEAEPLLRDALAIDIKSLGAEHRRTLVAASNLARTLSGLGRTAEADSLFQKTLASAQKTFPADSPLPSVIRGYYGEMLTAAQRFDEAETQLLEAHARLESLLGPHHARTMKVAAALSALSDARGKSKQAATWRTRPKVGS